MRLINFFDKTIKIVTRQVAAGEDGRGVFPLVNTSRKRERYPIVLKQFTRAIEVDILKGNTNHKLERVHHVRGTTEEASNT